MDSDCLLLTILIDFILWADHWLTDHPELRRTTQPSTIGGPLCDPGFCIFRSTDTAVRRNFQTIYWYISFSPSVSAATADKSMNEKEKSCFLSKIYEPCYQQDMRAELFWGQGDGLLWSFCHTIYPIKYAHGLLCFVVISSVLRRVCDLSAIFFRVIELIPLPHYQCSEFEELVWNLLTQNHKKEHNKGKLCAYLLGYFWFVCWLWFGLGFQSHFIGILQGTILVAVKQQWMI